MRSIVTDQLVVEVILHGLDAVIALLTPHSPEVLVEQGLVRALDEAVRLRTPYASGTVLDLFELKEQIVGQIAQHFRQCLLKSFEHALYAPIAYSFIRSRSLR